MRPALPGSVFLSLLLLLPVASAPEAATAQNRSHAHIGHVATAFQGTPEGMGLLPTAEAEAQVAAQHAGFAARDLEDLASMQRHSAHVLHAVDPERIEGGPGNGYGLIRAAEGVVQHIEAAAGDGASENVQTHSVHVASAAGNAAERARRMAELAERIAAAGSADEAAPLVTELNELAQRAVSGHDANGDGRVGWQEGEGGLEAARTHLGIMMRGEGLG